MTVLTMLSAVFMGVVVLTQWLWIQHKGLLHLYPALIHLLNHPHPLHHNSLFPLAHLLPRLQDTPSPPHLPLCLSPSAIALTLSPLPGGPLPHLALLTEDSVSLGHLQALQGRLFHPTPQSLCHHLAPSTAQWAHTGFTTNPLPQPLLWYPILLDQIPNWLRLVPGSHRLGTSSAVCMPVCGASKHTKTWTF